MGATMPWKSGVYFSKRSRRQRSRSKLFLIRLHSAIHRLQQRQQSSQGERHLLVLQQRPATRAVRVVRLFEHARDRLQMLVAQVQNSGQFWQQPGVV